MHYVRHSLRVPDEGSLIALTRVDADGTVLRLAYVSELLGIPASEIVEVDVQGDTFEIRTDPSPGLPAGK